MNSKERALKAIRKSLLKIDLFGKDVQLTINNNKTHNTLIGTSVTILIYIFLVFTTV
jgi:hypothetical protein